MSNTSCLINNPFNHWHWCSTLTLSQVSMYNGSRLELQRKSTFRHLCGPYSSSFWLSLPLWFLPPLWPQLGLKIVNLQGWRTGQVGWPSAAWPWAERGQSEAVGLSPGLWRGAQRMCPSRLREACRGRWWCRRMRKTSLEEGWRAALEEQPGAEEHGKMSRRTGGRKQTCYDFDDGAMQAAGQGGVMEEGGTDMKNKHKKLKTQNIYNSSETTKGHTYVN